MPEAINILIRSHQVFGYSYRYSGPNKHQTFGKWLAIAYNVLMIVSVLPMFFAVGPQNEMGLILKRLQKDDLVKYLILMWFWIRGLMVLIIYVQIMINGPNLIRLYQQILVQDSSCAMKAVKRILVGSIVANIFSVISLSLIYLVVGRHESEILYVVFFLVMSWNVEYADLVIPSWLVLFSMIYVKNVQQMSLKFDQILRSQVNRRAEHLVKVHQQFLAMKSQTKTLNSLLSPSLALLILVWSLSLSVQMFTILTGKILSPFSDCCFLFLLFGRLLAVGYFGEQLASSLAKLVRRMETLSINDRWTNEEMDQLALIKNIRPGIRFTASDFFSLNGSFVLTVFGLILQNVVLLIQTAPLIK